MYQNKKKLFCNHSTVSNRSYFITRDVDYDVKILFDQMAISELTFSIISLISILVSTYDNEYQALLKAFPGFFWMELNKL